MGYGKGGEIWICLTCFEGVLDGRLYRKLFGGGKDPEGPHPLIQWLNYLMPETRSLPECPGMFTLTSPQRHTVYLWIAVHLHVFYICENPNVKKLLDTRIYIEKAFPNDVFLALDGNEALYLDEATRDFRGYASDGKVAELRWSQVLNTRLSDSLAMSDKLVEFLFTETMDENSMKLGLEQQRPHMSGRSSDEEEEEEEGKGEGGDQNKDQDESTTASVVSNAGTNPLLTAEPLATPPNRGTKRNWEEEPIFGSVWSKTEKKSGHEPMDNEQGSQCTDHEGEEERKRRAELAWQTHMKSVYFFDIFDRKNRWLQIRRYEQDGDVRMV